MYTAPTAGYYFNKLFLKLKFETLRGNVFDNNNLTFYVIDKRNISFLGICKT